MLVVNREKIEGRRRRNEKSGAIAIVSQNSKRNTKEKRRRGLDKWKS